MNAKDLHDIGEVIYWLAAVRADVEDITSTHADQQEKLISNALRCLKEAEDAAERIAAGTNRKPPPSESGSNSSTVTAPQNDNDARSCGQH